jgi:hypothetical protein
LTSASSVESGILPEPKEKTAPRKRSGEVSRDTPPKPRKHPPTAKPAPLSGALFFAPPAPVPSAVKEKQAREKKPKTPRAKAKIDPQLVAKARELRDRYLERVNESPEALPAPAARYDVSRTLPAMSAVKLSAAEGSRSLPAMSAVESAAPDASRALPDAA